MWHRRHRVQFRRSRKQSRGLVMVEAKDQRQPLIEELLGQRRLSRNRVTVISQSFQQLCRLRRLGFMMMMLSLERKSRQPATRQSVWFELFSFVVLLSETHWQYRFQTTSLAQPVGKLRKKMSLAASNASALSRFSAIDLTTFQRRAEISARQGTEGNQPNAVWGEVEEKELQMNQSTPGSPIQQPDAPFDLWQVRCKD